MKQNFLRWLGIILILEVGLLHFITAQAEYEEAAYMGYLFIANFCGALLATLGIYRGQRWGWWMGVAVSAGSIFGYIWSRTLGMPGMNVEEWFTPYGVVSLAVEGIFLVLVFMRPWSLPVENVAASPWLRIAPVMSVLLVGGLALGTYQWDANFKLSYGHHVGSLDQVCSTPPITFAELRDQYGVEVSLAATSMMGSIVDVRLKVVDPEKAHALLKNQAALLVGQDALVLAPHLHSHGSTRLKVGKIFTIFFPTQRIIKSGTAVSLVMGPVRVEPIVVR